MSEHRFKPIIDWQHEYVAAHKYPGSSILIQHGGEERFFSAVGLRDIEHRLPFERDTLVRLYSMTKPITSLAIMMLIERGLMRLDTPLDEILPEFSNPSALIGGAQHIEQCEPVRAPTVQELLTHTAGLSYAFNPGVLPEAMDKAELFFQPSQGQLKHMVARLAALPLAFRPGTRWEYSVSCDVLGHVVERISGCELDEFFQTEIFAPLGMENTKFKIEDTDLKSFSSLYIPDGLDSAFAVDRDAAPISGLALHDSRKASEFSSTTLFSGGGGLIGTIDDYARFLQLIRNRGKVGDSQLVQARTIDMMMQNHLPGDIASMGPTSFAEQPMHGMGFGLGGSVLLDSARAKLAGSAGDFSWGGIASTYFWIDPIRDLQVIFFTQLSPSSTYSSRAELKSLVSQILN